MQYGKSGKQHATQDLGHTLPSPNWAQDGDQELFPNGKCYQPLPWRLPADDGDDDHHDYE